MGQGVINNRTPELPDMSLTLTSEITREGVILYRVSGEQAVVARLTYLTDAKAYQPSYRLKLEEGSALLSSDFYDMTAAGYAALAAVMEARAKASARKKRDNAIDAYHAEVRALMNTTGDIDFNVPGDSWTFYMDEGMTAAEAIAAHREHGSWTLWAKARA